MATEEQELEVSQAGYAKVGDAPTDVQHHHPGEPVGSIPLSIPEGRVPHHRGANPSAKPEAEAEAEGTER